MDSRDRVIVWSLLTVLPYYASKVAIAVNTAIVEYNFGVIGGASLAAESDTLHWEFLWMGSVMGGMRAITILAASKAHRCAPIRPLGEALNRANSETTPASSLIAPPPQMGVLHFTFRGMVPPPLLATDASTDPRDVSLSLRLGVVANTATIITTLYCIPVMCLFYYSGDWFFIARRTNSAMLGRMQDYGRGFWWGVLPTQWLYLNEQFALGVHASGIALVYGGVVYAVAATVIGVVLVSGGHGVWGLGVGMSAGAWIGWIALKLHLTIDPYWRALGLNGESLWSGATRRYYVDAMIVQACDYLRLSAPLALANISSLARGLIVAAVVSEVSTNDATAYSISGAYFETLNVAVLAASSCISAVVAASSEGSHTREYLGQQPRRIQWAVCIVVLVSGLLGLLPLVSTERFARIFGAQVYAIGDAAVDRALGQVELFNYINFAAYSIGVVYMAIAATLHGFFDVSVPLLITVVGNVVGGAWTIVWSRRDPANVTAAACGPIVAQVVAAILGGIRLFGKWKGAIPPTLATQL